MYFILGAVLGSFLNTVAERSLKNEKWTKGRSRCPSCGHELPWFDLIPILSFLLLKGRCRYCKTKISFRYPLAEIVLGFSFYLATRYVYGLMVPFVLFGICIAYISALTDLYEGEIFDSFTIPFAFVFLALRIFFSLNFWFEGMAGAALGLLATFIIVKLTRQAGDGDITFLTFLGAFLGFRQLIFALVLSSVVAGGVILPLLTSGRINMKSKLPLAPFLFAGTVLSFWM